MRALVLAVAVVFVSGGGIARADDWTPLQHAAMDNDTKAIEALLAAGAKLEATSPAVYQSATAFVIALEFGSDEAAKLLLDRGASTAGDTGKRALALAARGGNLPMVDALLARKVPIGADAPALFAAAKYGYVKVIARLLAAGAKPNIADANDHRFTPLMVACMENKLEAARVLVAAGARVDDVDDDKKTALHWAVFGARPEELHEYAELGGPHTTDFIPQKSAPIVELLLAHHARTELATADGNTPLHEAAMLDVPIAAKLLLAAGAHRDAKNKAGKTPLELARARKNSVAGVLAPTPP